MLQAKTGDKVKVHYTGRFPDGSVFDSSEGKDPLEFIIGSGQVIKGFEDAVIGMSPGDTKTADIKSHDAYGAHHEEMVVVVERNKIPENIDVELGSQLQLKAQNGQIVNVEITSVTTDSVTLDANHPLAGKDLVFQIDLVDIV